MPTHLHSKKKGFTLLEILVVIAILMVATAIAIPMYFRYQVRSDLSNASAMIMQGVNRARVLAQSGYQDSEWGFSAQHSILFKGTSYDTRDTAFDEFYPLNQTITASGTTEVWFDKISGKPNAPGSIITLISNTGELRSINLELNDVGSPVNLQDQITICHNPNGPSPVTMYITDSELPLYLAQGDIQGQCPLVSSSSSSSVASSQGSSASAASSASSAAVSSASSAGGGGGASSVAVAVATKGVYVLSSSSQGTLDVSGNGTLTVVTPGALYVNSNNAAAIKIGGNGSVVSPHIYVSGTPGYQLTSNGVITGTVHAASAAVADPLASLATPSAAGSQLSAVNVTGNASVTLSPNTYASIAVSGNALLTLTPGVYYLNGSMSVSGNGRLTGSGVMIYLAAGTLSLTGNGSVNLKPPSSGTFQGVTIYQNRTLTSTLTISGNGNMNISGALYGAAAPFVLNGNAGTTSLGSLVIAKKVTMTGNASFRIQ